MKFSVKRVKVKTDFQDKDAPNLLTFGRGTVTALTGSTDFPTPTVAVTAVGTQLDDMETIMTLIAGGDTRESNTQLLQQKADIVMASLAANGHYVEDIANKLAAGDTARAKELILSAAYEIKVASTPGPRDFKVVSTGIGWAHIHTARTTNKKEMFHWEFGITTGKNVAPATLSRHTTFQVDIIITDLPSGAVIGIRRAPAELAGKIRKYEHPTFSHLAGEQLEWSEFIYFIVP
jgi:hypothetical protein